MLVRGPAEIHWVFSVKKTVALPRLLGGDEASGSRVEVISTLGGNGRRSRRGVLSTHRRALHVIPHPDLQVAPSRCVASNPFLSPSHCRIISSSAAPPALAFLRGDSIEISWFTWGIRDDVNHCHLMRRRRRLLVSSLSRRPPHPLPTALS